MHLRQHEYDATQAAAELALALLRTEPPGRATDLALARAAAPRAGDPHGAGRRHPGGAPGAIDGDPVITPAAVPAGEPAPMRARNEIRLLSPGLTRAS